MKKLLACIFAVSVISTAAFSKNFFSQRFFEVKVGAQADFSNNLFGLNDFLKKDLVVDLRKIANECPGSGFNIRADAQPSLAFNVNIRDIHVGFSTGSEVFSSMTVSDDLFDFLGYGNTIGEAMDFDFRTDADIFAFSKVDVGFRLGKFKINVQPALFLPILSIRDSGGTITVVNDSDGNLFVHQTTSMTVYSIADLKANDGAYSIDDSQMSTALARGYGFDIGGGVSYQLTNSLNLEATCRIPLIPGHLYHKATIESGSDYNMKLTEFSDSESTKRDQVVTNEESDLAVIRPLKLNVYANKDLLGSLFTARGGLGFGVRRPFSDSFAFYPEYYLGINLNLINIFKIGVSTEYTDQIFIHQLGTTVNVRVFQLDLGISTQSSSFVKSLSVAGVGAYAYVTMGF